MREAHRIIFSAIALLCVLSFSANGSAQTVYVTLGSDTSIWTNTGGGGVANTYANEFDFDVFANPTGVLYDIMEASFRNAHQDSFGRPFPFTWYMHGGGWFQEGTNTNAVGTTYLIRKHWQTELEQWGDEIAYHFHHFDWNGAWVMADTFGETLWDFEWTLAQMMIDEGVFPMSFRSGWNYMDDEYQQCLEKWMPYRLEGWSNSQSVPYHPSFSDYRVPGSMKGWEVRHYYMATFSQSQADQLFGWASGGNDQVACLWSHQNEGNFITQIAQADTYLHNAAASHPGINLVYGTAIEVMKQFQGTTEATPPPLELSYSRERNTASLRIDTAPDIYQVEPFVAARRYDMQYVRLPTTQGAGGGHWSLEYPADEIDRVVVGVSDIYGNVSLEEVKDGSRRWATQSEFHQGNPEGLDIEQQGDKVVLNPEPSSVPVVDQGSHDSQTEVLERSYWIGQSFVPQATGISAVSFGATVAGSAEYVVELRSCLPSGFPDDTPEGLLASGTASFSGSGTATAYLSYNGLILDGRSYALVFKILSGQGDIRLNTTDVYPHGILLRAYSLDWIEIPQFDCYFQTFDQFGVLDQSQPLYNGDAYASERGRFISQTFQESLVHIGTIEFSVAAATSGETVEIHLRKTLLDGSPDLSLTGLLAHTPLAISGPGVYQVEVDWPVPAELQGEPLALTFVSPQAGLESIRMHYQDSDAYGNGQLYSSQDLTSTAYPAADLYLKIFQGGYVTEGKLSWDFDAGELVGWTAGRWNATLSSEQTRVRARFRCADTQEGLDTAPWSGFAESSSFSFGGAQSRWLRLELTLESTTGADTPVLDDVEILYCLSPTSVRARLWMLY